MAKNPGTLIQEAVDLRIISLFKQEGSGPYQRCQNNLYFLEFGLEKVFGIEEGFEVYPCLPHAPEAAYF